MALPPRLFCDTSFFYATVAPEDAHYERAGTLLSEIDAAGVRLVVTWDVIKGLASDGEKEAVIVPIGFVCDHVEVLHDLDVAVRAFAEARGVALHRAMAVNDHPAFIAGLADLVLESAA